MPRQRWFSLFRWDLLLCVHFGTQVPLFQGRWESSYLLAGAREAQNQISALQLPRNLYVIVLTLVVQLAACVYYYYQLIDTSALSSWRWMLFIAAPWACLLHAYYTARMAIEFIFHLLFGMKVQLDKIHQLGLCQDVCSLCVFVFWAVSFFFFLFFFFPPYGHSGCSIYLASLWTGATCLAHCRCLVSTY